MVLSFYDPQMHCLHVCHPVLSQLLPAAVAMTEASTHPRRSPVLKPICLNPRSSQTESSAASCAWDMKHKQAATHSWCTHCCSARELPSSCRRTSTALFSKSIIVWSVHPSAEWMSRWMFRGANSDLWSSAATDVLSSIYHKHCSEEKLNLE